MSLDSSEISSLEPSQHNQNGYNIKMDESYSLSDETDSKHDKKNSNSAASKGNQLPDMWSQGTVKKEAFFMFGKDSKSQQAAQPQPVSKLSSSELYKRLRR